MAKRWLIGVVLSLGLTVTAGATPVVVATHAVFAEFAAVVGGDLIEVVTIIPSGFCPGHYDLRPSDLAAVVHADLILYSGFERWMDTLAAAAGERVVVVRLSGPWNTPIAASSQVDAVLAALAQRYPDHAGEFENRARAYKADLAALGADLRRRADEAAVASVPVISMTWQADFVRWLGFDVVATYGVPESLSLRDLVELATVGRKAEVSLVIDNLQSGVQFGAKLAREVSAIHVVLSNFPGAMPDTGSVLELLAYNAGALFDALKPIR